MTYPSPEPQTDLEEFLHFRRGDRWQRLPGWGRFFIRVGAVLAPGTDGVYRTVVAIAVPARGYSATLSASGAVLARAKVPVLPDLEAHFTFLSSLPAGTVVRCVTPKGTKQVGKLEGCTTENGVRYVKINAGIKAGSKVTRMIQINECGGIQPVSDDSVSVPKHWAARLARPEAGLVDALLEPSIRASFRFQSRIECVIVGNERALQDEAKSDGFAMVRPGVQPVAGRLQDILRVRRFGLDGECFRSQAFPSSGGRALDRLSTPPPIVIFDGSLAFLNRGFLFPSSNWLVILDQTESRFSDAVNELRRLFVSERIDLGAPLVLPDRPKGIDVTVFGMVAG